MLIIGFGFTVTIIDWEFSQPFKSVPVTVYVAVEEGLNPTPSLTPSDQEYEVAPPPVRVTDVPAHTVLADEFAVTVGVGLTVITTVCGLLQSPLSLITVYVVVAVGLAITSVPVVVFNPDAGLHI